MSEFDNTSTCDLRNSLTRCCERLKSADEKYRPLAAMLFHQAILGNKPEPFWPKNFENQAHYQLTMGGGPRSDPRQLRDANGQPAVGEKPYFDIEGRPMVYSTGEPIALYPGARRTYSLYGKMFRGSDVMVYSEGVCEYNNAAAELGLLLDDLPEAVKKTLWQDWPHGFTKPSREHLWTNAVFELSWQKYPASGLRAERTAWHKNTRLAIGMRASDLPNSGPFATLFDLVGDPPAFWYSWIDNIWQASIGAIDLLVSMLRQSPAEIASCLTPEVDDDHVRILLEKEIGRAGPPEEPTNVAKGGQKQKRTKRSTIPGEARELIIAALNEHHRYCNGRCEDTGHVGVNKLARFLELSPSTVSAFFKQEFGSHNKYRIACGNLETLANALRMLNGELKPSILFNSLGDNDGNLPAE